MMFQVGRGFDRSQRALFEYFILTRTFWRRPLAEKSLYLFDYLKYCVPSLYKYFKNATGFQF